MTSSNIGSYNRPLLSRSDVMLTYIEVKIETLLKLGVLSVALTFLLSRHALCLKRDLIWHQWFFSLVLADLQLQGLFLRLVGHCFATVILIKSVFYERINSISLLKHVHIFDRTAVRQKIVASHDEPGWFLDDLQARLKLNIFDSFELESWLGSVVTLAWRRCMALLAIRVDVFSEVDVISVYTKRFLTLTMPLGWAIVQAFAKLAVTVSKRPTFLETCPAFLIFSSGEIHPRGIRLISDVGWAMIVHSCKLMEPIVKAFTPLAASTALLRIQLEVAVCQLGIATRISFHEHMRVLLVNAQVFYQCILLLLE